MAHVPITAHRPEAGDRKFRVIQGYADRVPSIRIRRVVGERQRSTTDESSQCRAKTIREVKPELLRRIITVGMEWGTCICRLIVPCSVKFRQLAVGYVIEVGWIKYT